MSTDNGKTEWAPRTGREEPSSDTKINVLLQEKNEIDGRKMYVQAQLVELIEIYNKLLVAHVQHIEKCSGKEAAAAVEQEAHEALTGVVTPPEESAPALA